MVDRLGEMRKGEERGLRNVAERIIQKRETKRQFEEKEDLRDPPFYRIF